MTEHPGGQPITAAHSYPETMDARGMGATCDGTTRDGRNCRAAVKYCWRDGSGVDAYYCHQHLPPEQG